MQSNYRKKFKITNHSIEIRNENINRQIKVILKRLPNQMCWQVQLQ